MARLSDTVKWRDFSAGNVQKVSSDIVSRSSIPFSMNLLFDKEIGEAVSREGTNIVNAQLAAGQTATGLYQHLDTTQANDRLFVVFNGTIYNAVDGSIELSGLTAANKCRFTTFMNATLMLNGAEARSYSGGSWSSSGGTFDIDNIPSGAQFPIEWKDRVYAAVTDRLHYTAAPSVTDSTVSWTDSGSGSIQIEREDGGGNITGLNKVPGYLLIYKKRSLKRWNFDSSFPEDLINIGTQSNESIVRTNSKNYFFYGPKGFYETRGGYPKRISRPVQRFIDAIPSSFYGDVNGWSDGEHVYWSVGDLTIDFGRGFTEAHNNVVLRYTIDTEQWAPLKYAHEFRFLHQYINSDEEVLIVGADTDGQVLQLNTGNSDYNGQAITYILQSPELDFERRSRLKTLADKIIVHSDRAQGAEIQRRLDYGQWESFGNVEDIVTEVKLKKSMTAKVFEFRLVDSTTGEQVKLRGLDFPYVDVHEATN